MPAGGREGSQQGDDGMMLSVTLDTSPAFLSFTPVGELVVSTYSLVSSSSRAGSLIVFPTPSSSSDHFTIPTSAGVFRFILLDDERLLASLTDGSLCICDWNQRLTDNIKVCDAMLLDVACYGDVAVSSDNTGNLFHFDFSSKQLIRSWTGHSLPYSNAPCEVWCCSLVNERMMLSGGEDAVLNVWDLRSSKRSHFIGKIFESGVTFVNSFDDHSFLCGSYDEHIRRFDLRNPREPLDDIKLGGGVWHVSPTSSGYVSSCMYGGWAMLDGDLSVVSSDSESGKGLLYGVGTSPSNNVFAYCTFNDKRVTIMQL